MLKFIEHGSRRPDKRGVEARRHDFDEIYQEFDVEQAAAQASRCSQWQIYVGISAHHRPCIGCIIH